MTEQTTIKFSKDRRNRLQNAVAGCSGPLTMAFAIEAELQRGLPEFVVRPSTIDSISEEELKRRAEGVYEHALNILCSTNRPPFNHSTTAIVRLLEEETLVKRIIGIVLASMDHSMTREHLLQYVTL